jgi:hypothetical protein
LEGKTRRRIKMGVNKGYTDIDRTNSKDHHVTAQPTSERTVGLEVLSKGSVSLVGADTVEANSTTTVINATSHAAIRGNIIRFTSGALAGVEAHVVEVDTDTITVGQTLSVAPSAGDGFDILRFTTLKVDSAGQISVSSGSITFTRDSLDQVVTEDTSTPSNNRPLPVKLVDTTGDVPQRLDVKETDYQDISSLTTGAWVEIIASTSADTVKIEIASTAGEVIELGTGAAASETRVLLIPRGGTGPVDCIIPSGTRLSVKAVSGNLSAGDLTINLIGE